jgi:hypothetical protein
MMGRVKGLAPPHLVWIEPAHHAVVVRWMDPAHTAGFVLRTTGALAGG